MAAHLGLPNWQYAFTDVGRGLHSFTFQLNVSAFCGIGGAFRGSFRGCSGVLGGMRGCAGWVFLSETAQVELKSGRV